MQINLPPAGQKVDFTIKEDECYNLLHVHKSEAGNVSQSPTGRILEKLFIVIIDQKEQITMLAEITGIKKCQRCGKNTLVTINVAK